MKTNKILSCLAAGLLFAAGACTDETKYEPADLYQGNEVYFDLEEIGELPIETDATSVSFHLYRVDTSKEITVGLESSVINPDGEDVSAIFGVPTEVSFPAGEASIEVPVSVVFADVESEVPYSMSVKIAGESATPYGATEGVFTLIYGVKYEPWAEYLAGQAGWFQMAGLWSYLYDTEVLYHKSINFPNLEQFVWEDPFSDTDWEYLVTVDRDYPVEIEGVTGPCYLAIMEDVNTTVQDYWYRDIYTFFETWLSKEWGQQATRAQIMRNIAYNGRNPSYYDTATGQIVLNTALQKPDIFATSSSYGFFVQTMQLPGFKKYNLAIYETGYNVDASGEEQKKFTFYKNDDTEAMKYGLYKGTLTDEEVAAKAEELLADEEVEAITENEYSVAFELESGDYTIVLIGIDGTDLVMTKTYAFSYEASSAFVTVGTCEFTDGFMNSIDTDLPTVTITCDVQEDPANPNVYRLKNPYRAWAAEAGAEDLVMDGNYFLTVNCVDPKLVYVEESNLGLREDIFAGPYYAYSTAAQMLAEGVRPATIKLRKQNGQLNGNTITFPVSTLLVATQSELPNYQQANTKNSFKIVLNLNAADSKARIEGRRVASDRVSTRFAAPATTVEARIR